MHRFPYIWNLKDAVFTKDKGNVFSCFSCGGGSTMGYKLAGYNVYGSLDIDPDMMRAYRKNHSPQYSFITSITRFKKRDDLPEELYNLEILDGSPPCSSFSLVGNREEDWGKDKVFREGQQQQVLDTLFFDFIDLAAKLKPKVIVAENVKGLLLGKAKEYVKKIYKELDKAGYYCQHWLLNSSTMGVPQRRERVFFIALRKDLAAPFLYQKDMFTIVPKLNLDFKEPPITFREATEQFWHLYHPKDMFKEDKCLAPEWDKLKPGDQSDKYFQLVKIVPDEVCPTLTAGASNNSKATICHHIRKGKFNRQELCAIGTYPQDYDFIREEPGYLIGMSVPPVMVAQIATEIYNQWLSKI